MSTGIASLLEDGSLVEELRGVRWEGILLAGAGTFVAGYLLTVLVAVVGPSSTSGALWDVLTMLGFIFYSAHNVPLDLGSLGQADWLSISASSATADPAVPVVVYYAIPMVLLLAAGFVLSHRVIDSTDEPIETVVAVLGFAVTYAVVAVGGTFVFTSTTATGESARLVLFDAAVFGFVYPLVFGAVGAGLGQIARYYQASGPSEG